MNDPKNATTPSPVVGVWGRFLKHPGLRFQLQCVWCVCGLWVTAAVNSFELLLFYCTVVYRFLVKINGLLEICICIVIQHCLHVFMLTLYQSIYRAPLAVGYKQRCYKRKCPENSILYICVYVFLL